MTVGGEFFTVKNFIYEFNLPVCAAITFHFPFMWESSQGIVVLNNILLCACSLSSFSFTYSGMTHIYAVKKVVAWKSEVVTLQSQQQFMYKIVITSINWSN